MGREAEGGHRPESGREEKRFLPGKESWKVHCLPS